MKGPVPPPKAEFSGVARNVQIPWRKSFCYRHHCARIS